MEKMEGLLITEELKAALNEGNALYEAQRYEAAIAAYQAIIEAYPEAYVIYKNIGNCYFQLQKYDQAEEYYRKVLDKDPENAEAYAKNAAAYAAQIKAMDAPLRTRLSALPDQQRWLVTSEGAGRAAATPNGDVFAMVAQRSENLGARITRDAERLLGTRGIQAFCINCPVGSPGGVALGGPLSVILNGYYWKTDALWVDGNFQSKSTLGSMYAISGDLVVPSVPDGGTTLALLGLALTGDPLLACVGAVLATLSKPETALLIPVTYGLVTWDIWGAGAVLVCVLVPWALVRLWAASWQCIYMAGYSDGAKHERNHGQLRTDNERARYGNGKSGSAQRVGADI
jgi:hypothetical protein